MSVYKPKHSETYVYDFQLRGNRFSGSTGAKSKREAQQVERTARERAKCDADADKQRASQPLTLDLACGRYWSEVGQYVKNPGQVEWSIDYLLEHLGAEKALKEIVDADVATLVSRRRGERVDNIMVRKHAGKRKSRSAVSRKEAKRVSPATVNRSVIEPLRRIILRARDVWHQDVSAIQWRKHKLKEPKERVRSLSIEEEARLFAALPDAYVPIVRFALRTGCRVMECINLRWTDIDWGDRRISILGKGDKLASVPMSVDIRDLLFPMRTDSDEFVFMKAAPLRKDNFLEPRVRITYRALYSAFRVATIRAGIVGLRVHDLRHTAATRLLKRTGNLKMAMKLLRHEDISTTSKYAAVLDEDLREALDAMAEPQKVPEKSPMEEGKLLANQA